MTVSDENPTLRFTDVRRRFDTAADSFDEADFVHSVTRDGLMERIEAVAVEAALVIDLGCGTGTSTRRLGKRFRGARVVGVDASRPMLGRLLHKRTFLSKMKAVQGDARAIPFADGCTDVVFANLLLPWIDELASVFAEVARVLRRDGLFAFATLGPDSLAELARAWRSVDSACHVRSFPDMHDVGDALVRAGLRDPVLDVDRLAVSYRSMEALFHDITATGARNSLAARPRGLTGKGRLNTLAQSLFGNEGTAEIGFELVYGHCWGAGVTTDGFAVDAADIPVRTR